MPRLALTAAQLTITQAQMLLTVPMQGFRACPASSVPTQHPGYFPLGLIGKQNLDWLLAVPISPENHDAHGVGVFRQPNLLREVPLRALAKGHLLASLRGNLRRHVVGPQFDATKPDFAIELQVADIRPL